MPKITSVTISPLQKINMTPCGKQVLSSSSTKGIQLFKVYACRYVPTFQVKTDLLEGILIGDIINQNGAIAISVVYWPKGMKSLLSRSVLERKSCKSRIKQKQHPFIIADYENTRCSISALVSKVYNFGQLEARDTKHGMFTHTGIVNMHA